MPKIESYRELKAWQLGIHLAKDCYQLTKAFPKEDGFGLSSEIRRTSAAMPAKIAEGYGRDTTGEFVQFLRTAQGSLKELETHLILAREIGVCAREHCQTLLDQADEIGQMLRTLILTLQSRQKV